MPAHEQHKTPEGFWKKITSDAGYYPPRIKSIFFLPLYIFYLLLLVPGFQLALSVRLQEVFGKIPLLGKLLRRVLWYVTTIYFGSEIDIKATIGSGIYMPHPYGIVIGGECVIGKNVSINQNVTLGRRDSDETGDPIIGDNVAINSGAVIVGAIKVGNHAKIGANSVVLKDVPDHATAVGVPAHIVSK
ncbi:MAG: serine acetyltransferase [Alphaproteobacteria bacterium]|nr:serine acetyltransferase [Alphaproteobacteria bacterium]